MVSSKQLYIDKIEEYHQDQLLQQDGTWTIGETLADLFGFTTYDSSIDKLLSENMIEVLECILQKKTFDYLDKSPENYLNYLNMVNMPFLKEKLEWGTSIRGAWFDEYRKGNIENGVNIEAPMSEINSFIESVIVWAKKKE